MIGDFIWTSIVLERRWCSREDGAREKYLTLPPNSLFAIINTVFFSFNKKAVK